MLSINAKDIKAGFVHFNKKLLKYVVKINKVKNHNEKS